MTRRKVTPEERNIIERQIARIREEEEYNQYALTFHTLQLDKGLELEFRKKRKQIEEAAKAIEDQSLHNTATIKDLEDQLERGVAKKK